MPDLETEIQHGYREESAVRPGEPPRMRLEDLLRPIDLQTFLAETWTRNFLHIGGQSGRLRALFPWTELSQFLEEHWLKPPRLQLFRGGSGMDPRWYMRYRSGEEPRVDSKALCQELSKGATLIVNNVDDACRPVRDLAISLEEVFGGRIRVNLYASWREQHGFDLHWDGHDVLVLQIHGRKHWVVHRPTRLYPIQGEQAKDEKPEGPPVWDSLLEDGDVLYIPRGWWHVATPVGEPCLHLTVGLHNPTGADFLKWIADSLRSNELLRRDVPYLASRTDQEDYISQVVGVLAAACTRSTMDAFMRARSEDKARPRFSFPDLI